MFDLIEESKKLISIRSVSSEGNRELVEYLAPFCRQMGLNVLFQTESYLGNEIPPDDEMNLIAHNLPIGSSDLCYQGLALVTHLDTVPAGDLSLWTETKGDPFSPTIKGDKIFGLGSADTKLDFLCKLQAIEKVGVQNIKIPLALIGTFGEERALAGARLLEKSGIIHPQFALVGEPSELQPVVAHKGILYLKAWLNISPSPPLTLSGGKKIFKGRAAHGSMPHLGDNAIEKAVQWIISQKKTNPHFNLIQIHGGTVHNVVPEECEIYFDEKGTKECVRVLFLEKFFSLMEEAKAYLQTHSHPIFDPHHTTANVGVIRTHEKNIEIEFDFRLIPQTDKDHILKIFEKISEVPETPLESHFPRARIEIFRFNPPMNTSPDSELVQKVDRALESEKMPIQHRYKSGNTEGAIFTSMGAQAIVIGPGKSIGNIHAPNEYNELSQLQKAVFFYSAFLRQFC